MQGWIRTWQSHAIEEVKKHLIITGDLKGDCANCKEFNLDYKSVKTCPQCGTEFRFITSRRFESHPGERFQIVRRANETRQDLIWVDYDDYRKLTGRQTAHDFFANAD